MNAQTVALVLACWVVLVGVVRFVVGWRLPEQGVHRSGARRVTVAEIQIRLSNELRIAERRHRPELVIGCASRAHTTSRKRFA